LAFTILPMVAVMAIPTLPARMKTSTEAKILIASDIEGTTTSFANRSIFLNDSTKNLVVSGNMAGITKSMMTDAEHTIRTHLNSQRKERCNQTKTYDEAGEIQFASLIGANNSKPNFVFQIEYGTEHFFVRIFTTVVKNQSQVQQKLYVEKIVPNPCEQDERDRLAITSKGISNDDRKRFRLRV
jgi:hypothetical protein